MTAAAGQTVKLHFTGLEQEFMLGLADGVIYKIVDIETQAAAIYWRLQRQQHLIDVVDTRRRERRRQRAVGAARTLLQRGLRQATVAGGSADGAAVDVAPFISGETARIKLGGQ